jgi:hypothetical protein
MILFQLQKLKRCALDRKMVTRGEQGRRRKQSRSVSMALAWTDWGKPRKASDKTFNYCAEIRNGYLPHTSLKRYCYNNLLSNKRWTKTLVFFDPENVIKTTGLQWALKWRGLLTVANQMFQSHTQAVFHLHKTPKAINSRGMANRRPYE